MVETLLYSMRQFEESTQFLKLLVNTTNYMFELLFDNAELSTILELYV